METPYQEVSVKSWCVDYYKSSQNASQSYTAPI